IFGHMQIEARINQQPEISAQFALWGQRGSRVIRGNLLAIPIERSFLYVEPVYLQARQGLDAPPPAPPGSGPLRPPPTVERGSTAIPELKQVIVAHAGQVLMRPTLEQGLLELFGTAGSAGAEALHRPPMPGVEPPAGAGTEGAGDPGARARSAAELAAQAASRYEGMRTALQALDWPRVGREMAALETTLVQLRRTLDEAQ
ncbi:MAG: hypothetical protein AB1505_33170, partial [Candidatus Latescibacterota bacterium]